MNEPVLPAEPEDCEVTECDCGGHLMVRIGRVSVELSRDEFAQLRQAVVEAAIRFNLAPYASSGQKDLRH